MRPAHLLLILLFTLCLVDGGLYFYVRHVHARQKSAKDMIAIVTSGLGLTDLCIATEARYTRHPALSDRVAPFMNHPGAIEHFPTGSFWRPPPLK